MSCHASSDARIALLHDFGIDGIVELYRAWLAVFFYVVVYRFINGEDEFGIFRGLKRGDQRYSFLTCKKFERLARFGKNLSYFGFGSLGWVSGSGLLVTLEYDSNRADLGYAWQHVGIDFNRWLCGIRSKFGNVSIVRVWESHESGYPHVHALLIFHDKVFRGKSMRNKRGKLIYRVAGSDFEALKFLSDGANRWSHGYSDFELVNSYKGGIRYLSKYLSKSTSFENAGSKDVKTLAMCWFFHKRSFGYQGEMFSGDVIGLSCNSNDVDSSFRFVGFDLLGNPIFEKIVRWRLFGFIVRAVVLWHDKAVFHKVRGSDLELVQQRSSNGEGSPNLYDVNSRVVFSSLEQRRLALSDDDNSFYKLSDF